MKALSLKSTYFIKEPSDLIAFYKALGWDGKKELDPTKVVLNIEDDKKIIGIFMEAGGEGERVQRGMFWLNYGPSASGDVPEGKVHIYSSFVR
jgi:hypothetical protein